MGRSQESFSKREKEKKKQKKKEQKAKRKEERKGEDNFQEFTYVDKFGNFHDTPPEVDPEEEILAEDIVIGIPKKEVGEDDGDKHSKIGIVTFFNEEKGYGFIKVEGSPESIFSHINGHVDTIKQNDRVKFQVEMSPKGPSAFDVRLKPAES
jgi:cold shock CspA family protein